jgi:hypothetical protein
MGGAQLADQQGIYGAIGVTSINNTLGSRAEAAVWYDPTRDEVWSFGGGLFPNGSQNFRAHTKDFANFSCSLLTVHLRLQRSVDGAPPPG